MLNPFQLSLLLKRTCYNQLTHPNIAQPRLNTKIISAPVKFIVIFFNHIVMT